VPSPLDLVDVPFLREALVELALLAVAGGVVGAWIVLRRLAFYSHAVGSATFPGLVTADATGISATLLALAVALGYAGGVGAVRRTGEESEAATALLLVTALALGVVLASDVFESGAGVDRLLFGTLLGLDGSDIALSGLCAVVALAATVVLGRAWAAAGFDPEGAPALGLPARLADLCLLALVALTAVAALPAVGALLVGAVFLLPAAAARLLAGSVRGLIAWAVGLALVEGVVGLYLAYWLDAPPGPPIAVLGASVYGALALALARLAAARTPASVAA
jgi:manganese/iron transport system permease protein